MRALDVRPDAAGSDFTLRTPDGEWPVRLGMPGRFNVLNALGAWAAARALGAAPEPLLATLAEPPRVPGRFEPVDEGQPFAVVVDYSHKPGALENVLLSARAVAEGRVIVVFGAGGDRDRGKRPLMGEIAARLADLAIVTSDNPRSEDPEAIVEEVAAGARGGNVEREVDRRAAIARAVGLARPGDIVVIAGKGHEQGQEFDGRPQGALRRRDGGARGAAGVEAKPVTSRRRGSERVKHWSAQRIAGTIGGELLREQAGGRAAGGPGARGDRLARRRARRPLLRPAGRAGRRRRVRRHRARGRRVGRRGRAAVGRRAARRRAATAAR